VCVVGRKLWGGGNPSQKILRFLKETPLNACLEPRGPEKDPAGTLYKLASLRVLEPLLFIVITNTSQRFIASTREFAFLLKIRTPSL
jgi:hypothetical protein